MTKLDDDERVWWWTTAGERTTTTVANLRTLLARAGWDERQIEIELLLRLLPRGSA